MWSTSPYILLLAAFFLALSLGRLARSLIALNRTSQLCRSKSQIYATQHATNTKNSTTGYVRLKKRAGRPQTAGEILERLKQQNARK